MSFFIHMWIHTFPLIEEMPIFHGQGICPFSTVKGNGNMTFFQQCITFLLKDMCLFSTDRGYASFPLKGDESFSTNMEYVPFSPLGNVTFFTLKGNVCCFN